MMLKDLFLKPVDRPIEGVIKADDEASLKLEVEEYVLTNEIEKRLETFLDAYVNYSHANGVWISGFFGSGKSHLLKILALLLESRVVEGVPILEIFLPKCGDNIILRGDLEKACRIPSRSILFNIDQKADVMAKTELDALVAVFVKVFDEMCGYYGKQAFIAQMERDLDSDGLFLKFKDAFKAISGHDWEWGRPRTKRLATQIDQAYAQATGQEVQGILDKYRQDYRLSIEDFAEQVHQYIKSQGDSFRLNFFVDEVGQYIAENVKLMTNLQTIAESLATKCRGRAWIIVTAQEELDSVVGEMTQKQANDFTKIMARFSNRLKLTSADVAEVIQKRLLTKNDAGVVQLSALYQEQANNFSTLFSFSKGTLSYRNYQDEDHFIYAYPFIPYQFPLFQSAIQGLSVHNAFEGRHSSVGERSMLAVFQQVAKEISAHKVGQLATFDLMFEGIRTALKAGAQRSILIAEKNQDNPFATRVLKALFLVKYVKEFKATLHNICVLMLESFSQDMTALRKQVSEALAQLEQETYIQRSGEIYSYLTDEEQDVQKEITNTEVDNQEVGNELEKLLFDTMLGFRKIRHDPSGNDYSFSRKVDDRLFGRDYELAIHFITPFHDQCDQIAVMQTQSMAHDELRIVLPQDENLVRELVMYKKTEKYIRLNYSATQQESIKRILETKTSQNRERYLQLQQHLAQLTAKAKILIHGTEQNNGSEDPKNRISKSFYVLIARVYPNLNMLQGIVYSENDIAKYLKTRVNSLMGTDVDILSEAEQEVFATIQNNSRLGVRTSLKHLVETFEQKPYGWSLAAILCMVAKLFAREKIMGKLDSELLEDHNLERSLRNTQSHALLILEPQMEFTPGQVRQLKDFFNDFFDRPPQANEAKALAMETKEALRKYVDEDLASLAREKTQYPFLQSLSEIMAKLKKLSSKNFTWFLTDLPQEADLLLDAKEDILDPILIFMKGPQRSIFDQAREFLEKEKYNISHVLGDDQALANLLADPHCFQGTTMQSVKSQLDDLQEKITKRLTEERARALDNLDKKKDRFLALPDFFRLETEQKDELLQEFAKISRVIQEHDLILGIQVAVRDFVDKQYPELLSRISFWLTPPDSDPGGTAEKKLEYIASRTIAVDFDKPYLANADDVEDYLKSMRKALLEAINQGKRVQV